MTKLIAVGLATLLLVVSGCGYQLRGTTPLLPADVSPIWISGLPTHDRFRTQLEQALTDAGAEIATAPDNARGLLDIGSRDSTRHLLTVNRDIRAQEYELRESFSFVFRSQSTGRDLPRQRLDSRRIFNQPLDRATREETELRREMRADLIRRLINRLRAQL